MSTSSSTPRTGQDKCKSKTSEVNWAGSCPFSSDNDLFNQSISQVSSPQEVLAVCFLRAQNLPGHRAIAQGPSTIHRVNCPAAFSRKAPAVCKSWPFSRQALLQRAYTTLPSHTFRLAEFFSRKILWDAFKGSSWFGISYTAKALTNMLQRAGKRARCLQQLCPRWVPATDTHPTPPNKARSATASSAGLGTTEPSASRYKTAKIATCCHFSAFSLM